MKLFSQQIYAGMTFIAFLTANIINNSYQKYFFRILPKAMNNNGKTTIVINVITLGFMFSLYVQEILVLPNNKYCNMFSM